jgi:hypothetical protein
VLGGQLGTGNSLETIKLWFAGTEVAGLIVTALATKPANRTEKTDAWARSFIVVVTFVGDYFVWLWKLGESSSIVPPPQRLCIFNAYLEGIHLLQY